MCFTSPVHSVEMNCCLYQCEARGLEKEEGKAPEAWDFPLGEECTQVFCCLTSPYLRVGMSSMPGLKLVPTKTVVKYPCGSNGKIINITVNKVTDRQTVERTGPLRAT